MPAPDSFHVFEELLRARWSCRAFQPDPIPREIIEEIVRAAGRGPSWCNAQPWQLVIADRAQTDALREKLMAAPSGQPASPDIPFPERYSGVHLDRRRVCGWQLYEAVGVTKGDREGSARQSARNFCFFDAPHVAILTSEAELGPYGLVDCGAFITGFMLAAQAKGVASIAQAAVAGHAPIVRAHFAIPQHRPIVCAISFGLADETDPVNGFRTQRAPLNEVVDWRWDT